MTSLILVPQRGHGWPPLSWTASQSRACFAKVGGTLLQAEDELASINMAIGASYGGVPALTAIGFAAGAWFPGRFVTPLVTVVVFFGLAFGTQAAIVEDRCHQT